MKIDTALFKKAVGSAVTVTVTDIEDTLETLLQKCENLLPEVSREKMNFLLSPSYYSKLMSTLDKGSKINTDMEIERFLAWHGIRCDNGVYLPDDVEVLLLVSDY